MKKGGKTMLKRTLLAALAAGAFALPAAAQDYVVGVTGALTGPRRQHLCARRRCDAHLYRPRQRRRRRQRPQDQAHPRGRRRQAVESRRQHQEAHHPGQRRPDGQCQPVFDLCAGDRGNEERRRAAAVRQRRLPDQRLSAGDRSRILHHRLRRQLRQPGDARLRQGDGQGGR